MIITKDFFKRSSKEVSGETPQKKSSHAKITIHFDVGFPNSLSIRGNGKGLSWDKGVTLKNISNDTWVYEVADSSKPFEFKILINDQMFELGGNHTLKPGDSIEFTPTFY